MSLRYSRNKDGGEILAQRGRPMRGFTLIELVVVIGLILILVGLTMAVGVAIRAQSETRQTDNVLILLDQAVKQWEIAADRQLSWGTDGEPFPPGTAVYDIQSDDPEGPEGQFVQLLARIRTSEGVQQILAQIDDQFLTRDDDTGELNLQDPWGKSIYLIHPGRVADPLNFPGDNADDSDGTIRTAYEIEFGVAVNRALLFVSAGPDGEFGDLDEPTDSPEFKATQDNVYSYQPVRID